MPDTIQQPVRIIEPSEMMIHAARALRKGPIMTVYRDGHFTKLVLRDDDHGYFWKDGGWQRMNV